MNEFEPPIRCLRKMPFTTAQPVATNQNPTRFQDAENVFVELLLVADVHNDVLRKDHVERSIGKWKRPGFDQFKGNPI